MDPEKKYPILSSLLSPFRKRHRKTLGIVAAALIATGQARSFAVATTLMVWTRVRLDSAINRFYRLLANTRVDDSELARTMADLLCTKPTRTLLVAIDWTEWHHGLRMLVAAAVTGKRGIPIFVQAFQQRVWRRSQNSRENSFLRVLAEALRRAQVKATILCDRGFRRVSWLMLLQQLRLDFVVRLMSDVLVELEPGVQMALSDVLLDHGQLIDLGFVPLRSDGKATVRVIGYWAPGAHEPWWVATSSTAPAKHILKLYDRRMTVEEQLRDTKGCRFGVKLYWTQFRDPDELARFFMLLAIALLAWTLIGVDASKKQPSLRLPSRKKGPRQSYVTIGLRIATAGLPHVRLLDTTVRRLLPTPALRRVAGAAVGGK